MKVKPNKNCIFVNCDCFSEVRVIDETVLCLTLINGERVNIPAAAFGFEEPFQKIPQLIPVKKLFAMFNTGDAIEECPVQLMAKIGFAVQPIGIDMGQPVYLCDMPEFVGLNVGPDLKFAKVAEVKFYE